MVAVAVLLLPLFLIFLVVAGDDDCEAIANPRDPSEPGKTVDPEDIPVESVGPYAADPQLKHAAIIMNAAADANLSRDAQVIGVMAAIGESALQNIDYGDDAGPDSRGLFQQRAQGWGTLEERMDPYTAAQGFYGVSDHAEAPGLVDIDGWESMERTLAINAVQGNDDPYHYEEYESVAEDIVDALADVELSSLGTAPAQPATLPLAAYGPSLLSAQGGADALHDSLAASGGGNYDDSIYNHLKDSLGPVKPHVLEATTVIATVLDHDPAEIGGYRAGNSRDPNGHPAGLAVDFMVPLTDEGKAQGDAISKYVIENAEALNIKYVIWYQQIWYIGRDTEWRDMEDRGSPTQNHLDHPHISFTAESDGDPRDADDAPPLPGNPGDGDENPECEPDGGGGGGEYPAGENEPGPWGGHENGRIPEDELATIPWAPHESLRGDAQKQLIALNNEFRNQFGMDMHITDAYRTYEEQEYLYRTKPPGYAAKPGTSKHGWALAVDLGSGINQFGTPQYDWMMANAGKYGWKNPEWAQQGGSTPEAWHWEYWGVAND